MPYTPVSFLPFFSSITETLNRISGLTSVNTSPVTTAAAIAVNEGAAVTYDLATNTIVMKMGTVGASAAGAASTARTHYKTFVYDSGDVFSLDSGGDDVAASVTGTTEAAFEAENASLTALTTDMTVSYRTGALTSGISYFITGT